MKHLRSKGVIDMWQREATAAGIASMRKMVGDGAVPADTPIGHLSDEQWGWLLCAGLCSWISTKAAQAVDEGTAAIEMNIRDTGTAPLAWDAGAVATILPELGTTKGVDWSVPIGAWPKSVMLLFLCAAYELMANAITAHDRGGDITAPQTPLNDAVPF
jgi:hypothetical protein